jgi:hypothetical protein
MGFKEKQRHEFQENMLGNNNKKINDNNKKKKIRERKKNNRMAYSDFHDPLINQRDA